MVSFHHRIINMSTGLGRITHLSAERRKEILDPSFTIEKLSAFMDEFVR